MPVFDLVAFGKTIARYAFILGIIAFMIGLSSLLGDMIISLWHFVSSSVDKFDSYISTGGGGNSSMSCFYYALHALGVDVSLGSFFVSFITLIVAWSGMVVQLLIFLVAFRAKNLLLEMVR